MAKSRAPSGLKITRNNKKFIFEWSLGETYSSQELSYIIATTFSGSTPKYPLKMVPAYNSKGRVIKFVSDGEDWKSISIAKASKSKTITVDAETVAIKFRVRGKASNKTVSDYKYKEFIIKAPKLPSVGMSVVNALTTAFAWGTPAEANAKEAFNRNEWQTALISNCETPISKGDSITSGWSSLYTSGANGSYTAQESGWDTVRNSFTRWVRVRSVGWGLFPFMSKWIYTNRVYASPNPPKNVSAARTAYSNSGYSVTVTWDNDASPSRPTDSISVSYAKPIPNVTITPPISTSGTTVMAISCPNTDVQWTEAVDPGAAGGRRTSSFIDPTAIPMDSCFYVKVTNAHDSNITDSAKVLATGGYGRLTAPSAPEESSEVPGIYTVSVQDRGTAISNAPIAVYFRTSSAQNERQFVGLIPPGSSSTGPFRIPDIPEGDTFSFGVQAFVGNYTPSAVQGTSAPTIFSADMLMSSDVVWGAGVPLPPKVTATAKGESTIHVTWNQSWADATEAELSWSDHEDAWESTDEPQTYIVGKARAGAWNISNLGVGTWYIRVRLIKTVGESVSYSAYSETQTVKLSASPDIPSLLLSSNVIPKDGEVTCYWAYVSGDGTAQKQAQIFEVFPEYEVVVPLESDNPYTKGYYEASPTDKYTEVDNPASDANPVENGWYEYIEGVYVLSEDTVVISGKTYYIRELRYYRSLDTSVVSGKTYYKISGVITYGKSPLAYTESAQHLTLKASDYGWAPGETHNLVVTVMSMSGEVSEGYSTPVSVTIADELSISILSSSLEYVEVPSDYDQSGEVIDTRNTFALTEFPLEFNISGMEPGNKVTCLIDRAEPFSIMLPDETDYDGFTGDIVFMKDFDTGIIQINRDDFITKLDDTASYRVLFVLKDSYGQSAKTDSIPTGTYSEVENPTGNPKENGYYELVNEEYVITTDVDVDPEKTYYLPDMTNSFEVRWAHQAIKANATIEVDRENNVTMIIPIQPDSGYSEGDVVDIYRLSADIPELIYTSAIFGTKYVDPYPATGIFGGYRIVYRTYNGDYKTAENEFAFTDYLASDNAAYRHDRFGIIIDFGGNQLILPGNVSFSNKWSKDFTLTKYLGGSTQGDWNAAVDRSMSAKTTIPVEVNPDNIQLIRRLADYPGICHIRTPDGSSFSANIDVNDDREEKWTTRISKISLDVHRCDPESEDGMTYDDWISRR